MFAKLTNKYCLTAVGGSENFHSIFQAEFSPHIPVIHATVGGTRLVGRCTVGETTEINDEGAKYPLIFV